MMDAFSLPEDDDDDIDIYAALGLNTPIESDGNASTPLDTYDPLAAFMDDDGEDEEPSMLVQETPAAMVTQETVEHLLATLARDLLDEERLQASLGNGHVDLSSLKVERDREAYHLSLIIDMGGHQIKPFATVVAVENQWKPMQAPKGLHARWKPLYDSLCQALARALDQQGRPSSL
jgi:hypothetical protein